MAQTAPNDDLPVGSGATMPCGLWIAMVLIVVVTAAFRLPSCRESFWLDELHSAWAVSDSFSEVAPRAAIGNQTTGYFHLLWFWSAIVGSGELPMRLSSVIASCVTSACLVVGVSQRTGQIWAGVVAGAVLAVDPNGVFFGSELRPYSLVMLCAVLAVWSMMFWLDGEDSDVKTATGRARASRAGARWRLAMLFWICVAALIHPTSSGVLSMLIPLAILAAWFRGRLRLWRADAIAAIVVAATLGMLALSSLPNSWENRSLWKAFGQANRWSQLWYAWSWLPILVVPLVAAVLCWASVRLAQNRQRHSAESSDSVRRRQIWVGLVPGTAALFGTIAFFCLSYFDWVPLWHRRYYVAALPLLAWTSGELSAVSIAGLVGLASLGRRGRRSPGRVQTLEFLCGSVVALMLLGVMLWYQGTLTTIAQGRWPVQWRGEHWREAVATVRGQIRGGDVVWLDSQLIEASFFRRPIAGAESVSDAQWEYLQFPLRGPYRLEPITVVDCREHESWIKHHLDGLPPGSSRIWLISRAGRASADRMVNQIGRLRPVSATELFSGRPSVQRLDFDL